MTDDDIRDMLRTKAGEATVSADAWDKIVARLAEAEAPARHLPRRLALVGVAAAAIAGTVVVANLPGPSSHVANTTTTTANPIVEAADRAEIAQAVGAWIGTRVPGVDPGSFDIPEHGDTVVIRFRGGDLATELFLQRSDGRWRVVSAASDLLTIDNPTYDTVDGVVAEAVAEADGELTTTYVLDDAPSPSSTVRVTRREPQHLGYPVPGAQRVVVRAVLKTDDGTTALVEQPAQIHHDPAVVTGSYVAVWPATDSVGLAALQQDADAERRPDLLDPQAVAGGFLSELLPRGETPTSFTVGDFRLGDPNSGEVPYTLSDGSSGEVLVRRTADDPKRIWYVTAATSDVLQIAKVRHEGSTIVADVFTRDRGTLRWTGATPIDVLPGQTVSIGRPNAPETGSSPIVLRLMDGAKTLAIFAQLG